MRGSEAEKLEELETDFFMTFNSKVSSFRHFVKWVINSSIFESTPKSQFTTKKQSHKVSLRFIQHKISALCTFVSYCLCGNEVKMQRSHFCVKTAKKELTK